MQNVPDVAKRAALYGVDKAPHSTVEGLCPLNAFCCAFATFGRVLGRAPFSRIHYATKEEIIASVRKLSCCSQALEIGQHMHVNVSL